MSSHPALAGSSPRLGAHHTADDSHSHQAHSHSRPPHTAVAVASKPVRHGLAAWQWAALGIAIGGGVIAALVFLRGGSGEPGEDFMRRMDAAALGAPMPNIAGGPLIRVDRADGGATVIATGVAPGDCVRAGWQMVRRGVLTINGTTPPRVSAAILTELCYQADGAEVRWAPRKGP